VPAVYETTLVPPGGTQPAGIAWMDTGLLSARLYSGSMSPGGGPYRYTAPVAPAQAETLVAAFNGGFKMDEPAGARAAPANGRKLLSSTTQGPGTFFEAWWARDFITMSARPVR
jgi:hypothetical protein